MHQTILGAGPAISKGDPDPQTEFGRHFDDRRGELLGGRYHLEKLIGRGGIGSVYLARDMKEGCPVAVKIRDVSIAEFSRKRITSEIRALGSVKHRNIVAMKDSGTSDGGSYIVMEYMDGIDLDRHMRRLGPIPYLDAVPVIAQILAGLGALHAQGIIHRDLKPHNVFLLKDGTAKIFDFDLSRFTGQEEPELLSVPGTILGTPKYLAPEAFGGQMLDHRGDIYAAGMIMYKMLCGELPFEGDDIYSLIQWHQHGSMPPPSSRNPAVPEKADRIALRALERDPELRYQSAEEMRLELSEGIPLRIRTPLLRVGSSDVDPDGMTQKVAVTRTMMS